MNENIKELVTCLLDTNTYRILNYKVILEDIFVKPVQAELTRLKAQLDFQKQRHSFNYIIYKTEEDIMKLERAIHVYEQNKHFVIKEFNCD